MYYPRRVRTDSSEALAETVVASSGLVDTTGEEKGEPGAEGSLTGTRLDHFIIGQRLGHGGMGEVYSATDTSLDRPVAIKVLRGDVTRLPGMTDRFLREARAQARFNHPNIVHIYYIGRRPTEDEVESLFFAMECIAGGDLDDLLARGETMPAEDARRAMIQVAQGLRAAHRAGVIHRDIKPSNLMVDTDGVIKIADFGLAKPAASVAGADAEVLAEPRAWVPVAGDNAVTQEGAMVGSPYYVAPEQAVGDPIDHRADMYSMGAAFYHLLSGRPPFEGHQPMALVTKHLTEPPPSLAKVRPDVPAPLARVVERLLAKKPEDRFADYDALLEALEKAAPQARAFAPFMTRAAAAIGDLLVAGLLIGLLGWIGLVAYLVAVTAGHALWGQTPAKYLLGIEVRRDDGTRLGWGRSLMRTVVSLWMPILAGATIALGSGIPELLETIESLRPNSLSDLENFLIATAISQGFLSLLYLTGLGMALFHAQRKTVHDIAVGSVVVYRLKSSAAPPSRDGTGKHALESLGRKLSSRPPQADE